MIYKLTATNHYGKTVVLDLLNPESNNFAVIGIDGLGPVEADVSIDKIVSSDGGIFNSARVNTRNIVISIIFLGTEIEKQRLETYKYFPVKQLVKLEIETENRRVFTEGYVESNSPTIFSAMGGTAISILCPDPYLYLRNKKQTQFSNSEPLFEFPFSNESIEDPVIEISRIRREHQGNIFYEGSVESGMEIDIHAIGEVGDITLFNATTRETMVIYNSVIESITGTGISNLDDILITTYRGQKSAKLLRNGIETNIINAISKGADWFQLNNGDNILGYSATDGIDNIVVTYSYKVGYEGV